MMWSRTALHVHWLSDTLAGALLGFCVAIIVRRIWFGPARRRDVPAR
jgi:undecaprenyl-diphosphatase